MDRKAMKKMFLSNKMAVVCTVLILIIVIASLMAPLSPYDPDAAVHIFLELMISDEIHLQELYMGDVSHCLLDLQQCAWQL